MQRQQIVQHGRLGLGKLGFHVLQPADQRGNLFLCLPQQRVCFPNEAVEIALVGADALCFHRPDSHTLMDGGELADALSLIAAVVDAVVQAFFGKLGIAKVSPCLPPCFQRFRLAQVRRVDSVEYIIAYLVQNALTVLVQHIFPPLLVSPLAVRFHGTDGTHDVKMWIGNATILLVWLMHGEVRHHAPAHKIVR